jgi:hypothetical protein
LPAGKIGQLSNSDIELAILGILATAGDWLLPAGKIGQLSNSDIEVEILGILATAGDWLLPAEEEGFEPSVPCGTTVFKTAAFDHSATPPRLLSAGADEDVCRPQKTAISSRMSGHPRGSRKLAPCRVNIICRPVVVKNIVRSAPWIVYLGGKSVAGWPRL